MAFMSKTSLKNIYFHRTGVESRHILYERNISEETRNAESLKYSGLKEAAKPPRTGKSNEKIFLYNYYSIQD